MAILITNMEGQGHNESRQTPSSMLKHSNSATDKQFNSNLEAQNHVLVAYA